jgi:hypothetical protein
VGPDGDGMQAKSARCPVGCVVGQSTFERSVKGSGGDASSDREFAELVGSGCFKQRLDGPVEGRAVSVVLSVSDESVVVA